MAYARGVVFLDSAVERVVEKSGVETPPCVGPGARAKVRDGGARLLLLSATRRRVF
jgi:hypothetical protein